MASLSSLRSQRSYWIGRRDDLYREIKELQERKKDIENALKEINKVAPNNAGDINNDLQRSIDQLDRALNYSAKDAELYEIFANKQDQGTGDSNISQAVSELNKELTQTDRDINDKEADYEYAKAEISRLEREIAAEKQRQFQESVSDVVETFKKIF